MKANAEITMRLKRVVVFTFIALFYCFVWNVLGPEKYTWMVNWQLALCGFSAFVTGALSFGWATGNVE